MKFTPKNKLVFLEDLPLPEGEKEKQVSNAFSFAAEALMDRGGVRYMKVVQVAEDAKESIKSISPGSTVMVLGTLIERHAFQGVKIMTIPESGILGVVEESDE